MIEFPSDDEIRRFANAHRDIDLPLVLRDLARIATIIHLDDDGFFGDDTVLAGGTAIRCFGGHRFTVTDVDTSTREALNLRRLDGALNWELQNQLRVWTLGVGYYEGHEQLEKAKPIRFEPEFSEIPLTENQAKFELTVNQRGLDEDPVPGRLRHDLPFALGVEDRELPLMDHREMFAEKVVGYCVNVLGKHYADVAFLAFSFGDLLGGERTKLRALTNTKLERGRELANKAGGQWQRLYAAVPDFAALRDPLENPERHLGVSEFGPEVRFLEGKRMRLRAARQVVRDRVIPWLFD